MPRDSCHVLHSTFNSHSFIVGALLNCFFTQSLLNLLFTTKKENSIANRQSSETGKILLHVLVPCLICLSSLSMIFLGGKVEVTPRLKFLPVAFPSMFHPFHVFCTTHVPWEQVQAGFGFFLASSKSSFQFRTKALCQFLGLLTPVRPKGYFSILMHQPLTEKSRAALKERILCS